MIKNFFRKKKVQDTTGEFEQIVSIIKKIYPELSETNIEKTTSFDELGFTSIQYINLMLSLEDIIDKDIDVIVEQLDFETIRTVGDLIIFISKMRGQFSL